MSSFIAYYTQFLNFRQEEHSSYEDAYNHLFYGLLDTREGIPVGIYDTDTKTLYVSNHLSEFDYHLSQIKKETDLEILEVEEIEFKP